jgi:hypothetical protein
MLAAVTMTELGRALGCGEKPSGRWPVASGQSRRALPAKLYYRGRKIFVAPPPRAARDDTQAMSPMDRDACELVREGRAGLVRFFQGRYSVRLGRVVRPRE